ncbi:hypothetical protein [Enterobacter roggenkampii]|uniref:hypothetical protein n=1 Tax=Enterobacter roggenkampii TaxID=1812935 RepID=UPI002FF587E4
MPAAGDEARIKIIEDAFLAIYEITENENNILTEDYVVVISNLEAALKVSTITPAQEKFFRRVLEQLKAAQNDKLKKQVTDRSE